MNMKQKLIVCGLIVAMVLSGCKAGKEEAPAATTKIANPGDCSKLEGYTNMVTNMDVSEYENKSIIDEPLAKAQKYVKEQNHTQEEYDEVYEQLKKAVLNLGDGSGYEQAKNLKEQTKLPEVLTGDDWAKRAQELRSMYEYYMYGVYRDGEGETLKAEPNDMSMSIQVTREGKSGSFNVGVSLPDEKKVKKPEGGWPVLICFLGITQTAYANDRGYAVITINTEQVASDSTSYTGAFYDVYPYQDSWKEQTGVLMAWGWSVSKVIDALEQDAGKYYGIDAKNVLLTGVSRWGKATAVAGAFDKRIKITAPSCSGAGGMALYRYTSQGQTYDFSKVDAPKKYTYTQNEPLSSLQSTSEKQWFNDVFSEIRSPEAIPLDQHMLASLFAGEDRYLFISGSYISEDWVNAPAMWATYLEAKKVFEKLNEADHIAICLHKEGHMVTDEDLEYLLDYSDLHLYGKKPEKKMKDLTTSLFATGKNKTVFEKGLPK